MFKKWSTFSTTKATIQNVCNKKATIQNVCNKKTFQRTQTFATRAQAMGLDSQVVVTMNMREIKNMLGLVRYYAGFAGECKARADRSESEEWRAYWTIEHAKALGKAAAWEWLALERAVESGLKP